MIPSASVAVVMWRGHGRLRRRRNGDAARYVDRAAGVGGCVASAAPWPVAPTCIGVLHPHYETFSEPGSEGGIKGR